MAIIYTYPKLSSLNGKDSFLVTDASDNNKTKTIAWEDVLSSNNLVQNKKITLTSAQILDLHNTPVELIPAPGSGKVINFINLITHYEFNTTPYTRTNNQSSIKLSFAGQTSTSISLIANIEMLESTIDCYGAINNWPGFPFQSNTSTVTPNAALQASIPATSPVTLGDSPIHVYLSYIIKDL